MSTKEEGRPSDIDGAWFGELTWDAGGAAGSADAEAPAGLEHLCDPRSASRNRRHLPTQLGPNQATSEETIAVGFQIRIRNPPSVSPDPAVSLPRFSVASTRVDP